MKSIHEPTMQQKLFLVHLLKNRGYSASDLSTPEQENIYDKEWNELVEGLRDLRYRISKEDEDTIKSIINKY